MRAANILHLSGETVSGSFFRGERCPGEKGTLFRHANERSMKVPAGAAAGTMRGHSHGLVKVPRHIPRLAFRASSSAST